jgi:hypothetical protein
MGVIDGLLDGWPVICAEFTCCADNGRGRVIGKQNGVRRENPAIVVMSGPPPMPAPTKIDCRP